MKILIVENDRDFMEMFSLFLEKIGIEAEIARSGNEAIDLITNTKFDLIVSDYFMENGSGRELVEYIIREPIRTKILILSNALFPQLPEVSEKYLGFYEKTKFNTVVDMIEKMNNNSTLV